MISSLIFHPRAQTYQERTRGKGLGRCQIPRASTPSLGVRPAAFQDILKWRRCSCDARGFIELFFGVPRLLGLPIQV